MGSLIFNIIKCNHDSNVIELNLDIPKVTNIGYLTFNIWQWSIFVTYWQPLLIFSKVIMGGLIVNIIKFKVYSKLIPLSPGKLKLSIIGYLIFSLQYWSILIKQLQPFLLFPRGIKGSLIINIIIFKDESEVIHLNPDRQKVFSTGYATFSLWRQSILAKYLQPLFIFLKSSWEV